MKKSLSNIFQRLLRRDSGAVAVAAAVFLPAMLALGGAVVDLGMAYSAKSELQNAADAAAIAGADTMISYDAQGTASMSMENGVAEAKNVALANEAIQANLDLLDEDIIMGEWDFENDVFLTTAPGNVGELQVCEVTARRDASANGPVQTYFAGIFGMDTIPVTATSRAFLGWSGDVPAGEVDLPIAVLSDAISGDGPDCGKAITFASETSENGEWTTFFDWPTNDPAVQDYVDGTKEIPALSVGDEINVLNGKLSTGTFNALIDRFNAEGTDTDGDGEIDSWFVTLPVVDPGGSSTVSEIVGFATFEITSVEAAPGKLLNGTLHCDMIIPDTHTGGKNFGSRATFSRLIP